MDRKEVLVRGVGVLTDAPGVLDIIFQPGNGTRYEIVLTDCGGYWVLSWPSKSSGGVCMSIQKVELLHHSYMEQKMPSLGRADIAALLVLVHEETHCPVVLPPDFNKDGLWQNGHESVKLPLEVQEGNDR